MHEFCWIKNFIAIKACIRDIIKIGIVLGISSIEFFPWMHHKTFLRIVPCKITIECTVPSSFIAIIPNDDRWIIHITQDHFLYQLSSDLSIISFLPTGQFIKDKQTKTITEIKKFSI